MRHGFIRTAAVTPKIHVADTKGNGAETIRLAREAAEHGATVSYTHLDKDGRLHH